MELISGKDMRSTHSDRGEGPCFVLFFKSHSKHRENTLEPLSTSPSTDSDVTGIFFQPH